MPIHGGDDTSIAVRIWPHDEGDPRWRNSAVRRAAVAATFVALLASSARASAQVPPSAHAGPRLVTADGRTRLEVNGRPFLILGGELANSSAASPASLKAAFHNLPQLGLNTVLVPVYWELVEPMGTFGLQRVKLYRYR